MASLAPLSGCGGVVFVMCVVGVRCLCGGGVRFGALCTIASFSYMMWQCSAFYFKNKK